MKHKQDGSAVVVVSVIIFALIVGALGWVLYSKLTANSETETANTQEVSNPIQTKLSETPKQPDSADTLSSPSKVTSADGNTYFVYGAPKGQNNKDTKRIVISLPGHGTTADDGYKAWKGHIEDGEYALAEFNWWNGTGEKTTDYYSPVAVMRQARAFLDKQGYDDNDVVVLHGFSRGSANTYAVIAQDRLAQGHVFDAVISNAGKYQADFPLANPALSSQQITELYTGIPWVLVCGGLDENPSRDGCPGMTETKSFLTSHGAKVLALLTDPNSGHGAFHRSTLKLPKQAFALIDTALEK